MFHPDIFVFSFTKYILLYSNTLYTLHLFGECFDYLKNKIPLYEAKEAVIFQKYSILDLLVGIEVL